MAYNIWSMWLDLVAPAGGERGIVVVSTPLPSTRTAFMKQVGNKTRSVPNHGDQQGSGADSEEGLTKKALRPFTMGVS
jgi:hypothetical protein